MANTDVKEMVTLCKSLGLRVAFETGSTHYSVRDPNTDAKLFYISSTPSDSNFKYEIARHLRRLGLLKGNLKYGKFKANKKRKNVGTYDLVALKAAQDKAASLGERIPLLEDIEGQTEFFQRIRMKHGKYLMDHGYTAEGVQEAIETMPVKATPRSYATKQRLRKVLLDKKMSNSAFATLTLQVAEARDLRGWKNHRMALVAINKFTNEDDSTMMIWGINLVEATLDHIEGLKWNEIDESRKVSGAMDSNAANDMAASRVEPQPVTPEEDLQAHKNIDERLCVSDPPKIVSKEEFEEKLSEVMEWVHTELISMNAKVDAHLLRGTDPEMKAMYVEKLLSLVQPGVDESVLTRLDKLVGLE